jgi:hypothetical protein
LQAPPLHAGAPCSVSLHILAHSPQLAASLATSTQAPLQLSVPAGQLSLQLPPLHTSAGAQALPHAPQWAGSLAVLTQLLSQLA